MKLVWTRTARDNRRAIREFIAAGSPSAALNFDALLSMQAQRLLDHPGIGRPGRVQGTRELVAHRHYVLVYDLTPDAIRVLRVLHTARQWPVRKST